MAFTNFYLIAGGTGSSDINAGSSIGAAQATTTNGNWNSATGVFIAASGTPFASTVVGDYASIYVDGATVTGFVGKVTAVTSSTQITVDVSSIKYGQTIPSTSATGRSCTINGSWNSEIVLAATGLATFTVPQSTKINIKQATITVSANRTISMAGSQANPLWFSGYNTTPGDLDNDTTNSLSRPTFSCGNSVITISGANNFWSCVNFNWNRNNTALSFGTGPNRFYRCRFINTNSGTTTSITSNAIIGGYLYCYFSVPTTATAADMVASGSSNIRYIGCVFEGGGRQQLNNLSGFAINCIFINGVTSVNISASSNSVVAGCTFRNFTTDAINISGTPQGGISIIGNIFSTITGTAINNASGANISVIGLACNDFYNCGNNSLGFGDTPFFFNQTDSSDPVVSASNLTPVGSSNAINNGFPGIFENESFSSYLAIGAVQPLGGGSAVAIFGS